MERTFKLSVTVGILILFFTMAIILSLPSDRIKAASKEPIKVGSLTDLTGPVSEMVIAMDAWGFVDYLNLINSKGGIMGHKINCRVIDTEYKMEKIITGYEQLVSEKAVAIMSSLSPVAIGLKKRLEKDKICVFLRSGTTEAMWPATYVYSSWPTWADSAGFIVDRLIDQAIANKRDLKQNPLKLAWIYADSPMGRSVLPAIAYAEARGCITAVTDGIPMLPTDTSSTLRRVKASGAEAVIMGHIPAPIIGVLKDAMRVGLDLPFYGTSMSMSDGMIYMGGLLAEGFSQADNIQLWYPEYQKKYPAIAVMVKQLGNKHPEGVYEPAKYRGGWACAMVLEEALKKAIQKKGGSITGEDVKNALDEMKGFDMQGIQPNVSFYKGVDNRGDQSSRIIKIVKKQVGFKTEVLAEPQTDYLPVPTILPKGYDAITPGLKELCKQKGWTYFSPESGLIMAK